MDPAQIGTTEETNSMGQPGTNHATNEFPTRLVMAIDVIQQHEPNLINDATQFRDPCLTDLTDSSDAEDYFNRHILQGLRKQESDFSDGYESPEYTEPESDDALSKDDAVDQYSGTPFAPRPLWSRQYKRFFRYRARPSTENSHNVSSKRQRGQASNLHTSRTA